MQKLVAARGGGVVGLGHAPRLPGREGQGVGLLPDGRGGQEPRHEIGEGGEHVVGHALGEDSFADVPVGEEAAGVVHDLTVDPDLGGLGDAVDQLAPGHQRGGGLFCGGAAEGAGEGDRQQRFGAPAATGHLPQYLDARAEPVVQVLPEAALHGPHAVGQGRALGEVHGEQAGGAEVADDAVDIGQQREPVLHGEAEGEARVAAPAADRLGEGLQENGGGGHSGLGGASVQGLPLLGPQPQLVPGEQRRGAERVAAQRQVGGGRQVVDPGPPVGAVALVAGAFAGRPRGEHVVAERTAPRLGPRSARTQVRQLGEQQLDTAVVADEQVDGHVQDQRLVGLGGTHVEQRPLLGRPHLVRHLAPRRLQRALPGLGGDAAQVLAADPVVRNLRQHPLVPLGSDHRAQHGMSSDQPVPGLFDALGPPVRESDLQIAVAGHTAVVERPAPPEQIGRLDVREREGLVRRRGIGVDGRPVLLDAQQGEDGVAVGAKRLPSLRRHRPLGRAIAQLPPFLVHHHSGRLEFGRELPDIHDRSPFRP